MPSFPANSRAGVRESRSECMFSPQTTNQADSRCTKAQTLPTDAHPVHGVVPAHNSEERPQPGLAKAGELNIQTAQCGAEFFDLMILIKMTS